MDWTGCGGKGGILGGEGGHVLSGLVTEGLRARDRGSVRLQWNQVSHLELQRAGAGQHQQQKGRNSTQDSPRCRSKRRKA